MDYKSGGALPLIELPDNVSFNNELFALLGCEEPAFGSPING
jgi:hypothetical protein